jgi:hypothetical protein
LLVVVDIQAKMNVFGDLDKRGVKFLEKRIALLETKPLPTQEQINCRNDKLFLCTLYLNYFYH